MFLFLTFVPDIIFLKKTNFSAILVVVEGKQFNVQIIFRTNVKYTEIKKIIRKIYSQNNIFLLLINLFKMLMFTFIIKNLPIFSL